MATRTETQYAIRTKQHDGKFHYMLYVDNGPGGPASYTKLDAETAKKQLNMYTVSSEPTVVTRSVTIIEDDWVEVETSDIKNLAELLHMKQCHANHEDQCSWYHSPVAEVHKRYEAKAKAILEKTSFEAAKELIEIL